MKKIVVIGSGGAGKSTFSKRLGEALDIEVIHLDRLYWKPNWEKTPSGEWEKTVELLLKRDAWVMDGNFGGTRELRIRASDTVIFLDIPRRICFYRILKRTAVYYRRTRPDMTEGCTERFDPEFLLWIWNFPKRARPQIRQDLASLKEKNIVVLRSEQEMEKFIDDLK